jgi:hypothetical protein
VPDVLADQVVPGHADQLAGAQIAELAQQHAQVGGDRGLARAWAAGEAHVQAGPRRRQPVALPQPVHQQQGGDLPDPVLDRGQADELPVELAEHLLDPPGLLLGAQLDAVVRGERWRGHGHV